MNAQLIRTISLATLVFSASSLAQKPPAHWRVPQDHELIDEARNGSSTRFTKASGDFNGDGVVDTAFVLKSTRDSGESLWVWLSQGGGGHRWQRLDVIKWPKDYSGLPLMMAVKTRAPGAVTYICFDSDPKQKCNLRPLSERPKVQLRNESLEYFKPESAASLYFWNDKSGRFKKVWLSD